MFGIITNKQQKQQRELFATAVNEYSEALYWHARKLVVLHEDAEDVVQNTFAKAWSHIGELKDKNAIKPWLYSIATREALTMLRRKNDVATDEAAMTALLANRFEQSNNISANTIEATLQKALLTLTEQQRVVFNLRYYEEMTYKDISKVMDITESTAKVHYHNAYNKIVEIIKK